MRDYVKWDYQPTSIDGVPESFARAYSMMMTQPQGPVYMCYDAALQEAPKTHDVPLPPASAVADALADGARSARHRGDRRQAARRPSTRCCCRNTPDAAPAASRASSSWPRLTGAAVWDINNALNFPNKHPLCLSMDKPSLKHTDLIVGLDVKDWEKQLTELNNAKRIREFLPPPSIAISSRSASPKSASANGRWTIAACSPARCARSATRRSAFRS